MNTYFEKQLQTAASEFRFGFISEIQIGFKFYIKTQF